MNKSWMWSVGIQIAVALVVIAAGLSDGGMHDFFANPLTCGSILLMLGVSHFACVSEKEAASSKPLVKKRLRVSDLMVATAIVGVTIAIGRAEVSNEHWQWTGFVLLVPVVVTVWIKWRFNLRLVTSALVHYGFSLVYAFVAGFSYCLHFNRANQGNPDIYQFEPWSVSMGWVAEMATIALLTGSLYVSAAFVYSQFRRKARRPNAPSVSANTRTA